MLIVACCAFGQDADYLMKQYKKLKGAEYKNVTKTNKKKAKKEKYINPRFWEIVQKIEKIEMVMVPLNDNLRDNLTENIKNIEGYENLYEKKNNTNSILSKNWSIFSLVQYYGIEDNDIFKDVIIRIDTQFDEQITVIIHIVGELSAEEVMETVTLKESKNIQLVE
jgi:hypothetical protein